jgi:hypothetical protein
LTELVQNDLLGALTHKEHQAMPTKKQRVQVALNASEYTAIHRMSIATGASMSSVISDLVEASAPLLMTISEAMLKAKAMNDGMKHRFRESLEKAEETLKPMMTDAMSATSDALNVFLESQRTFDYPEPTQPAQSSGHDLELSEPARSAGPKAKQPASDPRTVITGVTLPSISPRKRVKTPLKATKHAISKKGVH